jgi:hypothetical protein
MVLRAYSRSRAVAVALISAAGLASAPAPAQLFWNPPSFAGEAVEGGELGIAAPLVDATPAEQRANMMWAMRAGLNVAALQCQFSPTLMTVRNYNALLAHHGKELNAAYKTITKYFTRTVKGVKPSQTALDQYTTRTYNGFSTLKAQLSFCQTASKIGYAALRQPQGSLNKTVGLRMREFRNSLIPVEDGILPKMVLVPSVPLPPLNDDCWDKRDNLKDECRGNLAYATARQ